MNYNSILKYGKSISAYFLASLIPMLLNLFTNPLIAMNMSPEDYAIVGYFGSFSSLITPLITFYMVQYYIRNYFNVSVDDRAKLRAVVLKALLTFSFVVAFLCYVGIIVYILVFNSTIEFPIFPYLLLTVASIPLSGVYSLQTADYKMERKVKAFFNLAVSYGVFNICMNLLFVVLLKMGAFGKLFAPVLSYFIFFTWVLYKNRQYLFIKTTLKDFYDILKFCWPLAAGAMLGYFSSGFDKTVLETLNNTTEYGIYIVGAQMAGYITVFSTSISDTFQPDVYEAIIKNQNRRLFKTYLLQITMVTCIVLVFILFCPLIIDILTAGRYGVSSTYARIIALSTIASTIYYNINGYAIGKGFPKLYLNSTILSSIIIIFLMPYVVKNYQYIGTACMTSVTFMIMSVVYLCLIYIQKKKLARNENIV